MLGDVQKQLRHVERPVLERLRLRDMAQSADERQAVNARLAELGNNQKVIDSDGFGIMPEDLKGNF